MATTASSYASATTVLCSATSCVLNASKEETLNHNVKMNLYFSYVEHLKASQKILLIKHTKNKDYFKLSNSNLVP